MTFQLFKNKNLNIAFIATFIVGIFTHIYVMVNPIFNDDSLKVRNNGMFTGGAGQGRWFGEIISNIAVFFGYIITVPFFAYFICILILSLVSVLIIKIFDIKNNIVIVFISSLVVTSTSLVQIFSYDYVSIVIVLSIFFGVLTAYIMMRINYANENKKALLLKSIFTIVLFAFTIGIYQISIPIVLSILVLDLLVKFIFNNISINYVIKRGTCYIVILVIGLVLYIILNKLVNMYIFNNYFLGGFYGMSENVIPQYTLDSIARLFVKCVSVPILLPFINYAGIATTLFAKLIVLLIYVLTIVLFAYCIKDKSLVEKLFSLFLAFLLIVAVNFQRIMITGSIQTRMTFSLVFIFILPLVLIDKTNIDSLLKVKKASSYLFVILLLHFIFAANANYYTAHIKNLTLRNISNQIVSKILNADGYNQNLPLIFIGGNMNNKNFSRYDYNNNNLSDQYILNPDYLFDGEERDSALKVFANFQYDNPEILIVDDISKLPKDRNVFYRYGHYGYNYSNNIEIVNMPSYPDDGCVKIIDDVVVVKISN